MGKGAVIPMMGKRFLHRKRAPVGSLLRVRNAKNYAFWKESNYAFQNVCS